MVANENDVQPLVRQTPERARDIRLSTPCRAERRFVSIDWFGGLFIWLLVKCQTDRPFASTLLPRHRCDRAALKSGNLAGDEADDQVRAAAHLLIAGRTSALARPALAASPIPILSLYGVAQDAQHDRSHRVAHPAPVFGGTQVQAVIPAVFNAPILAG